MDQQARAVETLLIPSRLKQVKRQELKDDCGAQSLNGKHIIFILHCTATGTAQFGEKHLFNFQIVAEERSNAAVDGAVTCLLFLLPALLCLLLLALSLSPSLLTLLRRLLGLAETLPAR